MKKLFFPLLAILLFSACYATQPAAEDLNASYLIQVESVPDIATRQEILLILRRARAKDVRIDVTGNTMTIDAAYYKADNDIGLLASMADNIRLISAVISVDLRDNPTVVRENR